MTNTPVTVLGLGLMGRALAGALLDAGHPTTVWNRTAARADELVSRGATAAPTVAAAVAASPLVIVCVLDYQVVDKLLTESGPLTDTTVVNLTNGTPEAARAVAARVPTYLDGGIMAVPSMIATPGTVILYSGSPSAFEQHLAALEVLGKAHHLGADPGLAALHDLALLAGMYGMFAGFLQAAALVRSAALPVSEFTTSLLTPWLHAMTGALPEMAHQIDTGDYAAREASLEMQAANDTIADVSRAQGVSPELLAPLHALMVRRVAEGHGADDFPSVIELLRT
jgi:3-hydroxyisobutyrate dehydrogenase-like beta-hydroxyacid dehydrogenase